MLLVHWLICVLISMKNKRNQVVIYTYINLLYFFILYNDQQMHN